MGYRASVITQEREYGSHVFSDWQQFDDYYRKLHELYPDGEIYKEENQDFYEIGKEVVAKEIKRLKNLDGNFEFQSSLTDLNPDTFTADTNFQIARAWEEALKEAPEGSAYVSLEWF